MAFFATQTVVLALAEGANAQNETPTSVLKKVNGEVDRLLRKKVTPGSAAEKKVKDEIRALAATLLDYEELSRQALKRHWGTLSKAQQAEFVRSFRELIERNYVKQLRTGIDYGVTYKGEKVNGDRAEVRTIVRAKRKGRMADTVVDYKMIRTSNGWRVWDIVTDEDEYSSLVVNYRSEFNKLWDKEGFDGIMKKIRKKLAENEE